MVTVSKTGTQADDALELRCSNAVVPRRGADRMLGGFFLQHLHYSLILVPQLFYYILLFKKLIVKMLKDLYFMLTSLLLLFIFDAA